MFKTAPRYLSGVSVFYGDDITRREVDGDIVLFIGPATKGPKVPLSLKSIDNSVPIYGTNNPLVKAMYQFWDGYLDSAQETPLRVVALRIGGEAASLTTGYGLSLETVDAWTGIENDFYIFADTSVAVDKDAIVRIWDSNKNLVFDNTKDIDTGHVNVTAIPAGKGIAGKKYGKDIDNDPLAQPVTIAQIVLQDLADMPAGALNPTATFDASAKEITVADVTDVPEAGTLAVSTTVGAISLLAYAKYTVNATGNKLVLADTIGVDFTLQADPAQIKIQAVDSVLVKGDSGTESYTDRDLYELFRNGLLEVEQFTPDYIIPGGVAYDAKGAFAKTYTESSVALTAINSNSTTVKVDAAATWPQAGTITINKGTEADVVKYKSIAGAGEDFVLTLDLPASTIDGAVLSGDPTIKVQAADAAKFGTAGYVKVATEVYKYTAVDPTGVLTLAAPTTAAYSNGDAISKAPMAAPANTTLIETSFTQIEDFELGIGFVKETDMGDHFEFEWSNVKQEGFYIAHFGYLFGNFCNEAAVGYNTPLCGMNVALPASTARADIVKWIGESPTVQVVAGMTEAVEKITKSGKGLLGEATLVGSRSYNRCYMNDKANNVFVDPAFGLLLTDEGFVDGHELKDTYQKVVDLGKYIAVGAGLMNFNHRASGRNYIDTCGIYAIGLLAGSPKGEGISFKQIGTNSNATVGVVVHRKLYNELAGAGYIVVTREKGAGWVVNNDPSAARKDSAYYLISTTRTIKTVIERRRAELVSFIGKPLNKYYYEAARTKLGDGFKKDAAAGLLNGYQFDLQIAKGALAIGKLYLKCVLNPPQELTDVDIDTVIDRNVTSA